MSKYRNPASVAAVAAVLSVTAFAQPGATASPVQDLLPVLSHSRDLGSVDSNAPLHIVVSLAPRDQAGLEEMARLVNDPNSVVYRMFLTPEEVGERYGPTQEEFDGVAAYLRANGMRITLLGKSRMGIIADTTVGQAERAFHTQIDRFSGPSPDGKGAVDFQSYTRPIALPSTFASKVTSVEGLEDYTRPLPRVTLLNPNQTRVLYNAQPLWTGGFTGAGVKIGISNWDGYKVSNASLYIAQYGLPVPAGGATSNIVANGTPSKRAQGEGDLDLQMVLGMAPLATIVMYNSSSNLLDVLNREQSDNPQIVSESWGWSLSSSTATSAHNIHLAMSAQGITYMCASGDNGTSIEPYSYPNFDPEVLQVGGSVANTTTSGTRVTENSWTGSGGGYSTNGATFNTKESWQAGVGPNVNYRVGPDIALHASGSGTGAYYFYYRGSLTGGYIGTSFASPVFAGCLGLAENKVGHRFGKLQVAIYTNATVRGTFTDLADGRTNGNLANGSPSICGAGWDSVTGWGYPNIDALATANPARFP